MVRKFVVCLVYILIWNQVIGTDLLKFRTISPVGGFGIEPIRSITQDSLGMMWFCSSEGFYRYNSNEFKTYSSVGDSNNLFEEAFVFIHNDSKNRLWLGTDNGLFLYNPKVNNFESAKVKQGNNLMAFTGYVKKMVEDRQKKIWIIIDDEVGVYNPDNKVFALYHNKDVVAKNIISDKNGQLWLGSYGKVYRYNFLNDRFELFCNHGNKIVNDILVDDKKDVWIATEGEGVFCVDSLGCLKNHYYESPNNNGVFRENLVRKLLRDSKGNIWMGTYRGLYLLDIRTNKIRYIHTAKNESLPHKSIIELFQDRNNNIWVGTWSGGLALFNYNDHRFNHYSKNVGGGKGLSDNLVSSFCEDKNGNLWIGTEKGGLNYWDRKKNLFQWVHYDARQPSVEDNNIKALELDVEGNLWIGTHAQGLWKRDKGTGYFYYYKPNINNQNALAYSSVYALECDEDNGIWIGTSGGGLDFLNFTTGEFNHYPRIKGNSSSLKSDFVSSLLIDKKGKLWVGTTEGLSLFDRKSRTYIPISLEGEVNAILNKSICAIYEDSSHSVWIGTNGNGLSRIDSERSLVENYSSGFGLNSSRIYGIIEDENENLWISSSNGIFCKPSNQKQFIAYDVADGLQSNIFSKGSVCLLSSGEIAFGGTNGFNIFQPSQIRNNEEKSNPMISALSIYNASVTSETHPKVLQKDIHRASQIVLNHKHKSFALEFCYPSYLMSEKNKFKYLLEGVDETWTEVGVDRRSVTYSNLRPGDYRFRLQACNNDGVWSDEEKVLNIKVKAAPWFTWWAFLCYLIIILGIAFGLLRFYWKKEKQKNLIQMEKEKADEIHKMKLQFFTNISHEFRTPLTLILGPIQDLLKKADEIPDLHTSISIINRNAQRLLQLVNQLLDFRKLENKKMELKYTHGNLSDFVKVTGEVFSLLAKQKQIDYQINIQETDIVQFDKDKLEKVMFNLLSNAFKHTNEGGIVSLRLDIDKYEKDTDIKLATLQVSNTGIPIPGEVIPKLFERYYQHKTNDSKQGAGIGLALTKQLVDLWGGEIHVESRNDNTLFKLTIPMLNSNQALKAKTKENPKLKEIAESLLSDPLLFNDENLETKRTVTILIVEDNLELLEFLGEKLKTQFSVLKAQNGKIGFDMALKEKPDIIISDVMMPEMNGLEMCSLLKSTEASKHIPVIILTARSSQESEVEGLNVGADAYIGKPFDVDYLLANIWNLYHQRKELRNVFGKKISAETSDIEIESEAEIFLQKAAEVMETHIQDESFNVSVFTREMGMGKTIFYKKMKEIAGMSVNEFIVNLRLKRALQLLLESDLNVAQISTKVGFKNPNYFSTCFKKQYKMSPKQYLALVQKQGK